MKWLVDDGPPWITGSRMCRFDTSGSQPPKRARQVSSGLAALTPTCPSSEQLAWPLSPGGRGARVGRIAHGRGEGSRAG